MNRRGHLRASDADRDRVVEVLRKAAMEGRIAAEELEQRVSAALKARTYGELDALTADLPGPRTRPRATVHPPARRRTAAGWALATVRANPVLLVFLLPALAFTAAMILAATVVWATLMVVVLILGGRPRAPRAPWVYAYRRGFQPYRPVHPRSRGWSYWA